jgi:acyl carrier protein
MTTLEQLNGILRGVFEDDDIKVERTSTANDVDGWDSLSHVNLIVAVETEFSIKFSTKELLSFKNVGDLVDSIDRKCAGK